MLADVLLTDVAVVIHEDLEQHHRVLTDFVEDFQNGVFVVVACIARVEQFQKDGLDEDQYHLLQVLSEVQEEAVKNGEDKSENSSLVRDAVPQEAGTKHILDYVDEGFHGQEGLLGLLEDGLDKLQTYYLGPDHVVTDLLIVLLLVFSLNTQFNYALEYQNCVIERALSFI